MDLGGTWCTFPGVEKYKRGKFLTFPKVCGILMMLNQNIVNCTTMMIEHQRNTNTVRVYSQYRYYIIIYCNIISYALVAWAIYISQ